MSPFLRFSDLSALAARDTSVCSSRKVILRELTPSSASQMMATLSPCPASTCLSTALKHALSFPPTNHRVSGVPFGPSILTSVKGVDQVTLSNAISEGEQVNTQAHTKRDHSTREAHERPMTNRTERNGRHSEANCCVR